MERDGPLKLFYCPSCARVFCLQEGSSYICGRVHPTTEWPDGKLRRFFISEKTETNKPPWPVPAVAEERELLNQNFMESWLDACPNPEDTDYGDVRRHFGYGAPGGKHLTKDEVAQKYALFVLKPVDG